MLTRSLKSYDLVLVIYYLDLLIHHDACIIHIFSYVLAQTYSPRSATLSTRCRCPHDLVDGNRRF